ncbi:MAG: non-hydrolyzing UDP-N-acetylglucosamine 2-epimerase [Planctomycetota bacterium]
MTDRTQVVVVIGTRPEAIKLAPVVDRLRGESWCDLTVVATAQHRELLDSATRALGLRIDVDLDLMKPAQPPADLLGRAIVALGAEFRRLRPHWVVAQGDTNTVLAAALAAFQGGVHFAHIEAGLRTPTVERPFPEEMNRRLVTRLASLHCAPTVHSAECLYAEGVDAERVVVTGNPVVDVLESVRARLPANRFQASAGRRLALVTLHRREHTDPEVRSIGAAIATLCDDDRFDFVIPVHPNLRCGAILRAEIGERTGVCWSDPLGYLEFLALLAECRVVLTDSGGVQEEAPSFGVPVLVLRRETERVEAIRAGLARLVGADAQAIVAAMREIEAAPQPIASDRSNPFGDGRAAARIVAALRARCFDVAS